MSGPRQSLSDRDLPRDHRVLIARLRTISWLAVAGFVSTFALIDLGLGVAIVPALHAVALQPSYRFAMTPIAGLAPLRSGWAAIDPRLLPASAQEFARMIGHGHGQPASPLVRSLCQPWEPSASGPASAR